MLELKQIVEYQEGQVVSKTLVQNELVSVTVFSFDKGEEISSHSSDGDAMLCQRVYLIVFLEKKCLKCYL